jgi:hypothetical protein
MTTATATTTPRRRRSEESATPPPPPVLDIKTMLVTPEQANKWLGANAEDQRNQRDVKIEGYARDMKAGKWHLSGDTIKLTKDGVLIDGQHRLKAVVKAGVPVYMVVVFNVDHAAMAVIDTGIARTFADSLRGLPIANRNDVAAVVRRITVWDRGNRMGKGGDNPTHQELQERFNKDADAFVTAAARGVDCSKARICAAGAASTAFYLFQRIDPELTHQFFDKLISGANLSPKEAILTVRERLIRSRRPGGRDDKLNVAEQLALLIRGWNAFRENRTLNFAMIAKDGQLNARNFPAPV